MKYTFFILMLWGLTAHCQSESEQTLLGDIIQKKFTLYAPDSLRDRSYRVTVTFEIDIDSTIINITPPQTGNVWLNNLVVESIKELPKMTNSGPKPNRFMMNEYFFTVSFPKITVAEGFNMQYLDTGYQSMLNSIINGSIPSSSSDISKLFNNSSLGDKPTLSVLLNGLLKENYMRLPENLRTISAGVRVSYEIDTWGKAHNIKLEKGSNKQLGDMVAKTIETFYSSSRSITRYFHTTKFSLSVSFPQMDIVHYMILPDKSQSSVRSSLGPYPSIKGGDALRIEFLTTYLKKNYAQTKMAKDKTIRTSVTVKFEVDENGKMGERDVLWGPNIHLNDFVIKFIKKFGDWPPIVRNGRYVRTIYNVSVDFPSVHIAANSNAVGH